MSKARGVAKTNFWRGDNHNLPIKKTSLKPNSPTKEALLAFQRRLTPMVYCQFAEKLNFLRVRQPLALPYDYSPVKAT